MYIIIHHVLTGQIIDLEQAWNIELNVELHTAFPKFTTLQSIECWHADLGTEFLFNKIPSTHKCKCAPTLHPKWKLIEIIFTAIVQCDSYLPN